MRKIVFLFVALCLFFLPVAADATLPTITPTPSIPQFPINSKLQLSNGTTSGTVIDCTNGSAANGSYCNNGGFVTQVLISSTDTSAQTLTCNVVNNSVTYQWFEVTVPANAGNSTSIAPLILLTQQNVSGIYIPGVYDGYGNQGWPLSNTDKITCAAGAVTSGKLISIFLIGGAF